jgi:hypothetical protein
LLRWVKPAGRPKTDGEYRVQHDPRRTTGTKAGAEPIGGTLASVVVTTT